MTSGVSFSVSTAVPSGTCLLHGAWDVGRYASCPVCSTAVPASSGHYTGPFMDPPPAHCALHGYYKAFVCPACQPPITYDPTHWLYKAGYDAGYEAGRASRDTAA